MAQLDEMRLTGFFMDSEQVCVLNIMILIFPNFFTDFPDFFGYLSVWIFNFYDIMQEVGIENIEFMIFSSFPIVVRYFIYNSIVYGHCFINVHYDDTYVLDSTGLVDFRCYFGRHRYV